MGRNNRQRRAEKRRDRMRSHRAGPTQQSPGFSRWDLAELLVLEAAEAAEHGEPDQLEDCLAALGELGDAARMAMMSNLVANLRAAWEGGWQPADVVRAAAKRGAPADADLVAEMIAVEARTWGAGVAMPAEWAAQVRDLARPLSEPEQRWSEPDGLRTACRLLGLLAHLPILPCLVPPPSQWGRPGRAGPAPASSHVDDRVLAKVRALLAKAESTEFEDEADALTAKAQELMARHAIDHAMVAGARVAEAPGGRRLAVDDPYADGRANLLAAVARANRCRTVWTPEYGFTTVLGFPADVDTVEVLYLSLLVQATRAMTASGSVRDNLGRSRTRSFRKSFLLSFAQRIGERLEEAVLTATKEAGDMHGSRLLPVLAGRSAMVDEMVAAMFPDLVTTSARISNLAGWAAGRAAADLAHLGPEQQLLPGVAV